MRKARSRIVVQGAVDGHIEVFEDLVGTIASQDFECSLIVPLHVLVVALEVHEVQFFLVHLLQEEFVVFDQFFHDLGQAQHGHCLRGGASARG